MATVAIASRPVSSLLPLWFGRMHSWWFVGQVATNVVAAWFIIRLVSEMNWAELGLGLLLGQGFLLSVWLALGGLPNIARFISVLLVTLAGALAVSDQRWTIWNWEDWIVHSSQVFIICFFMVLLFHGLLLPLRWLLGWRLDFDPSYHPRQSTGRLQLGVMHFLGWTTFLAIPCGMIRLVPAEEVGQVASICLSVSAMTLPIAAVFAMAVLGRNTWRWTLLAAAVFGITWTAEVFIPGLIFSEHFLQFNLGIVAAVTANLMVLRFIGLRLFSVLQTTPAESEVRKNSVNPLHFAVQPGRRQLALSAAGESGS